MGKYYITYSCGHDSQIELFGKESERQKKIAYLEQYGDCPECARLNREKMTLATEVEFNLPDVKGVSDKQTTYARNLRATKAINSKKAIEAFRKGYKSCGKTMAEIKAMAEKKPESPLGIAYYCVIETDAAKIIEAFK